MDFSTNWVVMKCFVLASEGHSQGVEWLELQNSRNLTSKQNKFLYDMDQIKPFRFYLND